ncbi:MAG: CbiX/SirB N-terminal domain-containing protein [Burkholderiales bacterium]|nr:CbiX/SirB N-terminal domain-containing protein [Burkholderiales bacterium]
MTPNASTSGIVLFAHGSRDPLWHKPMEAVAAHIATVAPNTPVACAYLELSRPDLPTAVADLVSHGVTTVSVLPLFLGVGKHAREDLPRLVAELQALHPGVRFKLNPSIGEDARLVQLLAEIALDSL